MEDWVTEVKRHAYANYEQGGWDILCECWDDDRIRAEIDESGADTLEGAIAYIADGLGVVDDHRADIMAEAF